MALISFAQYNAIRSTYQSLRANGILLVKVAVEDGVSDLTAVG
jgi:hypothetical protein